MTENRALDFTPVDLADYDKIFPYTSAYGEGSCQHSPVSMFSQAEKYGDSVCIQDGFLYTLRSHLCDEAYRVYLSPLGEGNLHAAFGFVLADAKGRGKKAKFVSLTERTADELERAFPGRFHLVEDPDLAEYMYLTRIMSTFSGHALKKRREEVHAFWRMYTERAAVSGIGPEDIEDILSYEQKWLAANKETHDMHALKREERMIRLQMTHFDKLHLSGIALRIDGEIAGFGYGTRLSDQCYDAIVEKGDRQVPHIYKVLRQESVKRCAMDCEYVNMEEDVGVPGLRSLKRAYQPAYLLRKIIATERD